jgi:hypothetical protein
MEVPGPGSYKYNLNEMVGGQPKTKIHHSTFKSAVPKIQTNHGVYLYDDKYDVF